MSNNTQTLFLPGNAVYEIKKSIFYSTASRIASEAEAIGLINSARKRYPDATHTVYAYILRENNTARFCDDGEPKGTAGIPVLELLRKEGITDAVITVTRYFGGTLLGAGGLVRAYTAAAKEALDKAVRGEYVNYSQFLIHSDYSEHSKLEYELKLLGVQTDKVEFNENVSLTVSVIENKAALLKSRLSEFFSGRDCFSELNTLERCVELLQL